MSTLDFFSDLKLKYALGFIVLGFGLSGCDSAVGGTPENGDLVIDLSNRYIEPNGNSTATISLHNSQIATSVVVYITSSNGVVATLSPESCVVSVSNACTVSVRGSTCWVTLT